VDQEGAGQEQIGEALVGLLAALADEERAQPGGGAALRRQEAWHLFKRRFGAYTLRVSAVPAGPVDPANQHIRSLTSSMGGLISTLSAVRTLLAVHLENSEAGGPGARPEAYRDMLASVDQAIDDPMSVRVSRIVDRAIGWVVRREVAERVAADGENGAADLARQQLREAESGLTQAVLGVTSDHAVLRGWASTTTHDALLCLIDIADDQPGAGDPATRARAFLDQIGVVWDRSEGSGK
jgi:hypothetical protein